MKKFMGETIVYADYGIQNDGVGLCYCPVFSLANLIIIDI